METKHCAELFSRELESCESSPPLFGLAAKTQGQFIEELLGKLPPQQRSYRPSGPVPSPGRPRHTPATTAMGVKGLELSQPCGDTCSPASGPIKIEMGSLHIAAPQLSWSEDDHTSSSFDSTGLGGQLVITPTGPADGLPFPILPDIPVPRLNGMIPHTTMCEAYSMPDSSISHMQMPSMVPSSTVAPTDVRRERGTNFASSPLASSESSLEASTGSPKLGLGTGATTLMIRNIPVMYTQDMLVQEVSGSAEFDFVYLPRSCAGPTNMSYAFMNFVSEDDALKFKDAWHKKRLARFSASKPLNISFADVQGLRANLAQLKVKRLRCMQMRQCQPLILIQGEPVPLQKALSIFRGESSAGGKSKKKD